MSEQKRTVAIHVPVLARVEGEGALDLRIEDGNITQLRLRIFEPPRFFEKFLEGRHYSEIPDMVARICGICPVAYQVTAAQALEKLFGVELSPWARAMRRVFYCGEWIQSHSLHIHLLAAPDFFGCGNAIELARIAPAEVRRGLRIQGLRNDANGVEWIAQIYSHPEAIASLARSTPIASHVKVDFELWGCPVNSRQMLAVVNALLLGVAPRDNADKVCTECKRHGFPCVLVSRGVACMGPVTRAGCGALCPSLGRDCYGCYGPAEIANTDALATQFGILGLSSEAVVQRFQSINSQAPVFLAAADKIRNTGHD